jgi:hypothetical protein
MARAGTLIDDRSPIVTAAVIAAQATGSDGFRQRDVRFFIELFSNWLEPTTGAHTLPVHNTQVQRHLNGLTKARLAQRVGRSPPRFHLTPDGLVELLRRLVLRHDLMRLDEFLLVFHILDAYGARLRAMAVRGSRLFALDLDQLVDPARLLARERERVAHERAKLAVRCEESRKTGALARAAIARAAPIDAVIREVEGRYPYELNSQKSLTELLSALPESWQREELVVNAERRADRFWEPLRALLTHYDKILADLQPSKR